MPFQFPNPFEKFDRVFGGGRKSATFDELVMALPGIFAWYPQTETSGLTGDNALGVAALDGTYSASATLNQVALPSSVGGSSPNYAASPSTRELLFPAAFDTPWDWQTGWMIAFAKPTEASLSDGATHPALAVYTTGLGALHELYVKSNQLNFQRYAGTNQILPNWAYYSTNWAMWGGAWDTTANLTRFLLNGVFLAVGTAADTLSGTILAAKTGRDGANAQFLGGIAHVLIGAGSIPTEAQLNAIYEYFMPGSRSFVAVGDSKSNENDTWPSQLVRALEVDTGDVWRERPSRLAVAGYKASDLNAWLATNLPNKSGNPEHVLLNVGANDQSAGTSEAVYKAQLTAIIDQLLAKFTSANIYVAHSYREDVATPTSPADMKTWTNSVISTYSSRVYVGHDETVWFAGDIATYSDDGAHYNAAGAAELVNQWMAILP